MIFETVSSRSPMVFQTWRYDMERITHAMRRERWKQIIQECNNSGKLKKDWLREHNINPKLFYRWQQKLRMEIGTELVLAQQNIQTPALFEPLNPPAIQDDPVCHSVIVRCGSVSIEVDENISDAFLLRLMRAASNV